MASIALASYLQINFALPAKLLVKVDPSDAHATKVKFAFEILALKSLFIMIFWMGHVAPAPTFKSV